jgi:hypothetical protein
VLFGKEILKIVPGRVSTEVDARFLFIYENNLKINILSLPDSHLTKKAPLRRH